MALAVCPKCSAAQEPVDLRACKKCGLAADRMEGFAIERDAMVPEVLVAAWDRAVASWEDQKLHDEVMRLVAQNDAYAWAAARYRGKTDPLGMRQLDRIRKAAELNMMSQATMRKAEAGPSPYRATTALLILLVVVLVAGLIYAMVIRSRTPAPETPAGETG